MGLFSFIKDAGAEYLGIGKTVAQEEADAKAKYDQMNQQVANQLEGEVKNLGLDINEFGVAVSGDKAWAFGEAASQEVREKAILVVGNTNGIAAVDDRMNVRPEEPVAEPQPVFHTVQSGDTLSKISKDVYGDPMRYNEIFEANTPMLSHPDKIYPGQVLRIPNA